MKSIRFVLGLLLIVFVSCKQKLDNGQLDPAIVENPISATGSNTENLPQIKFEFEKHNFGTMHSGEKKSIDFTFVNTGKSDLIIEDAKGSCGCTIPKYPKEPIKPGNSGVISVTFNSEGKQGIQNKSVTLITNCIPSTKFLEIKANVE